MSELKRFCTCPVIFTCLFFLSGASAYSQNKGVPMAPSQGSEKKETSFDTSAPVAFSGKSLKASRAKGEVQLKGDVVLVQDDTRVQADSARLVGDANSLPQQSKKPKVTAKKQDGFVPKMAYLKGNVYLDKNPEQVGRKEERITAKAHEVEYNIVTRKVVLRGRPEAVVTKGEEMIKGEIITLLLETGEVEVVGARGVVMPGAHEKNKPKK